MAFKTLLPRNRTAVELQLEETLAKKYFRESGGVDITADTTKISADSTLYSADNQYIPFFPSLIPDLALIKQIHDAQTCPVELLPWLAFAWSVDDWNDSWSESVKREVIATALDVHKHKGTPYAIKKALGALGYDNIIIKENGSRFYNAEFNHDAAIQYKRDITWPEFDVILNIGFIPNAGQIARIRKQVEKYKNERSILRNLVFMQILYNDTINHNGQFKHNGGAL